MPVLGSGPLDVKDIRRCSHHHNHKQKIVVVVVPLNWLHFRGTFSPGPGPGLGV